MLFVLVLLWFDAFQIVCKWHTQRVQNHWFCKFGAVLHTFAFGFAQRLQICTQKPWLANVQLVTANLILNQKHTAMEITQIKWAMIIDRASIIHRHIWDYMFAAIFGVLVQRQANGKCTTNTNQFHTYCTGIDIFTNGLSPTMDKKKS